MNKLKIVRTKAGVTQQQLAESLGVTRQAISMIETNKNELTINMAKKIAEVLKIPWTDLFSE